MFTHNCRCLDLKQLIICHINCYNRILVVYQKFFLLLSQLPTTYSTTTTTITTSTIATTTIAFSSIYYSGQIKDEDWDSEAEDAGGYNNMTLSYDHHNHCRYHDYNIYDSRYNHHSHYIYNTHHYHITFIIAIALLILLIIIIIICMDI